MQLLWHWHQCLEKVKPLVSTGLHCIERCCSVLFNGNGSKRSAVFIENCKVNQKVTKFGINNLRVFWSPAYEGRVANDSEKLFTCNCELITKVYSYHDLILR